MRWIDVFEPAIATSSITVVLVARTVVRAIAALAFSALVAMPSGARAADGTGTGPTGEADPPTPSEQALAARLHAAPTALATGSDLRLRLLFGDQLLLEERVKRGIAATGERASLADAVERARGSTDPLVLALLLRRCALNDALTTTCDRVDIARRWTVADTQNQVSWLALAAELRGVHDLDGARDAVKRAAEASTWRESTWDIARLMARAAPPTATPNERYAWLMRSLGMAFMVGPHDGQLDVACERDPMWRNDPALRAACLRIAATMARDADSMLTWSYLPNLALRFGASDDVVDAYRQRSDALRWGLQEELGSGLRSVDDEVPASAEELDRLRDLVEHSERDRVLRTLRARHVPESEAARRYVASLAPGERAARDRAIAESRVVALSAGSTRSTAASP